MHHQRRHVLVSDCGLRAAAKAKAVSEDSEAENTASDRMVEAQANANEVSMGTFHLRETYTNGIRIAAEPERRG